MQFYYHLAPHFESKGNLQFAERSGREYVFWLYHAHIDEFAEAWESRHTAIRGNQRSTPRCIGQPIEAALKTLALNGFLPGTISNNGPAVGTPVVTGQNPDPYTSNSKGARVDLTTTPFLPDAKRVPWLLGLPEGEAVAAVRALGMVPHTGDKPALRPDDVGRVVGQWPPASWIVPAGSDVHVDVARAVEVEVELEVDWPW